MNLSALKLTPRRENFLKKMGITTLESLLKTYPIRYENIERTHPDQWEKGESVAFEGIICSDTRIYPIKNRQSVTSFRVMAFDREFEISLFNRPWKQGGLGTRITIFGLYQGNERISATKTSQKPLDEQLGLHPVYALPKDMRPSDMEAIMEKALPYADTLPELVPARYKEKYRLLDRARALVWVHKPRSEKHLHQALRTLKYEEFLCFQTALQSMQHERKVKHPCHFDMLEIQKKINTLPYALTEDQQSVLLQVLEDMKSDRQMVRLVQGDVGCGKTVVAAMALYAASLSGKQAALLAPTEILARQHLKNLQDLGMEARLLTSSLPAKEKREVLDLLKTGELLIVVGTHSLFSDPVEFDHLGLVIADEQQRFGVRQRRALLEKGEETDFLMMSATPIPRTYAHFLYGDIALSSIKTMPPNRKPVLTKYVKGTSMKPVLKEVMEGLASGRQLYVVCPSIEENEEIALQAAEKIYEGMKKTLNARWPVDLLHGKMKTPQKEEIMARFKAGETRILVSTTVVEVGIDVSNATMMAIYDAHRFGLSSLHQLRGRAARGSEQGLCWLISPSKDPQAMERLKQMESMTDGFSISEYDLKTRGPGDLLGTRQSGLPAFLLADLEKDTVMMELCIEDAREILAAKTDTAILEYAAAAAENMSYVD